jgi:hypothetical protein
MKLTLALIAFLFATPALAAQQAQILGCHKQSCSQPRKDAVRPPVKRVGPANFCLQNKDGYCRSTQEFWKEMMLRS